MPEPLGLPAVRKRKVYFYVARESIRLADGVDADTLRRRALHDARGTVLREGRTYRAGGSVVHWVVRRAVAGRSDQFEFVANGRVKLLAGPRLFPIHFRPHGLCRA